MKHLFTVVMVIWLLCTTGRLLTTATEEMEFGNHGNGIGIGQTEGEMDYDVASKYGSRVPMPTSDAAVVRAAHWSAEQLDGSLISIQSAEKQLVAGFNYFIHLTLGKRIEVTNCVYTMRCYVVVWTRAWLHSRRLLNFRCTAGGEETCV